MSESDNKEFDLGEKVDLLNMQSMPTPGMLPHPQGDDNPWGTAQDATKPLSASAPAVAAGTGPGLNVGGYNPSNAAPVSPSPAAPALESDPVPAPSKRPVPLVGKITRKETALLKKFRETFGLARIDVAEGIIKRRDPNNPDKNVSLRFGLRGLSHEDYQWVLEKASSLQSNPKLLSFSWKIACCSLGTASFEGEPIWSVLGFEAEDPEHTKDPMYPHIGLRFQAAEAWCDELSSTFFDTVEDLYRLYESNVDNKYIAKDDPTEEGDDVPLAQPESNS